MLGRPNLRGAPFVGLGYVGPSSQLLSIRSGSGGVTDTLKLMAQVARQYKVDPVVRQTAAAAVQAAPEKDDLAEAAALQDWVRSNIRYTGDVLDVETLQTPPYTLQYKWGDCDDQSTLLAALLMAVGIPAAFCAVGVDGEPFSHVMTFAQLRGYTPPCVSLETTLTTDPQTGQLIGPGWFPQHATSVRFFHI
jgi:transglutaminase-like putative cysteine protease